VLKIKINLLLISCFFCFGSNLFGTHSIELKEDFFLNQTQIISDESFSCSLNESDNFLIIEDSIIVQDSAKAAKDKLVLKLKRRKKIIASILAFPFPFGIIGLHRLYLGCKPYVPLAYIALLGGELGIIPFIDFVVLITTKDVKKFQDNPNLIMWSD